MKLAFWITGAPCSGKSFHAIKMGERLNLHVYHLDLIDDRTNIDDMTKEEGYRNILKNLEENIIIEGIIPFTFKRDMEIVQRILSDYKIIYLIVEPEYDQYLKQVALRNYDLSKTPVSYLDYYGGLKEKLGRFLVLSDNNKITDEDLRNLNYQHDGFTDVKFKQLKIDPKGKTVLDLGCSACSFEEYLMEAGALKYTGLDVNKVYLANKNTHLFDINNLEDWKAPADIVICSSVIHYIHDKEKFISEACRLTNELFVLEVPLDRGEGKVLHLGSRGLYFPTRDLLEEWIFRYFRSFKCLGPSVVEDGSYRLIYHCFK